MLATHAWPWVNCVMGACIGQVVEHWTFSIFFCMAELWGSVVISVLFWTLANELCSVTDAKTIYPLMGISANMALVVAGNYVKWINRVIAQVPLTPHLLERVFLWHTINASGFLPLYSFVIALLSCVSLQLLHKNFMYTT